MPPKRKAAVWSKIEDVPERDDGVQLRRSSRRSTVEKTSRSTPQISPTKKRGTPIHADKNNTTPIRAQELNGSVDPKDSKESEDTIAFRRLLAETQLDTVVRRSPQKRNRDSTPADDFNLDDILCGAQHPKKRSRLSEPPQLLKGKPSPKKAQTSAISARSSIIGSADNFDLRPLGQPPENPLLRFDFDDFLGGNYLDTPDSPERSPSPPSEGSNLPEISSISLDPNETYDLGSTLR